MRDLDEVSILLPLYGESSYLDFAIDSIVTQNFPSKWELIIVHRNSTETIKRIKGKYSNFEKHFVYLETKQGLTGALNEGLGIAKYGLIARMDSDDLMLENRIITQVSAFMNDKSLVALGGQCILIDELGSRIGSISYPTGKRFVIWSVNLGSYIPHPGSMIRREAIITVGGYLSGFEYAEDYNLWLRLKTIGKLDNLKSNVIAYRKHASQITEVFSEESRRATVALIAIQNSESRFKITDFTSSIQIEKSIPVRFDQFDKIYKFMAEKNYKKVFLLSFSSKYLSKFLIKKSILHIYFIMIGIRKKFGSSPNKKNLYAPTNTSEKSRK